MELFPDPKIILLQFLPFLVLLIGLNILVFQPMLNYLEERRKRIEGVGDRVKHMASDSEHKAKEIEAQLVAARSSVAETRASILRTAQARERLILEAARKNSEANAQVFRQELEATRKSESERLHRDVDALGHDIATRVLGRAI